jgi:hypothetical protein
MTPHANTYTATRATAIRARIALLYLEIDVAGDQLCDAEHAEIAELLDELEFLEGVDA